MPSYTAKLESCCASATTQGFMSTLHRVVSQACFCPGSGSWPDMHRLFASDTKDEVDVRSRCYDARRGLGGVE
ncbi:hypothetical protein ACCO45_009270 [Purpureocillium lilacinum]|uniref:Uncharacterized protein n=1 Tax=Purpureocillium lilacinum TaxID=33203 RepID=A0ACC4DKP0_PURLI